MAERAQVDIPALPSRRVPRARGSFRNEHTWTARSRPTCSFQKFLLPSHRMFANHLRRLFHAQHIGRIHLPHASCGNHRCEHTDGEQQDGHCDENAWIEWADFIELAG